MSNPVTVWERLNKKTGLWEHNHVCNGHTDDELPTPHGREQCNSWPNGVWRKTKGYMSLDYIITKTPVL